jgi:hypothetical protein
VKEILPHISIGTHESGCVVLEIEDYELFDFIDDYLTDDCDILYEARTVRERPGGEIITMYFSHSVSEREIERHLAKLAPEEIESIYKLNNK